MPGLVMHRHYGRGVKLSRLLVQIVAVLDACAPRLRISL